MKMAKGLPDLVRQRERNIAMHTIDRQGKENTEKKTLSDQSKMKRKRTKKKNHQSDGAKHVIGAADGEGTTLLQIEHFHNTIIGQKGIAPGPDTKPHRLVGEIKLNT